MNYLIYGTSYKLIDAEINRIIKDTEREIYDLEETSLEEVLNDISYDSMFDENKVIILKNFGSIKDDSLIKKLINYLKSPSETTTLILVSKEKLGSKALIKELLSYLKIIETPVIKKSYELAKILGEIIKQEGYTINSNALNIFAEKCALNYDIAINEFEKLKKFKKENKSITESDIELFVSNYNMNDIFAFKDTVVNRNIEMANKMLDDLEYSKIDIVPLVIMLAKEYQTIYNIKLLSAKRLSNEEIGKTLGNMHPYRVQLLRTVSAKYSDELLEKIILYLCDLDRKLISEDNLGFDELRKFFLEI